MRNSFVAVFCVVLASIIPHARADSLFNEATYRPIMSDHRSFDTGQSLTVLIYEQASAASSADTDTNRSTDISGEVRGNDNRNTGSLNLSNNFEGGGTISRSGKLMASVTVTITDKLDSGELLIAGEQVIEFNNEKQHIRLSGRVRPEDIDANNTILSTRVADARITYVGDGLLGKRQKPGIFTRFFGWLF
jgi:flagellar L-ring protein precursor FlgH